MGVFGSILLKIAQIFFARAMGARENAISFRWGRGKNHDVRERVRLTQFSCCDDIASKPPLAVHSTVAFCLRRGGATMDSNNEF